MRLLVLNGPNLNLLGSREPHIYGSKTLKHLEDDVRERHPDVSTDWRQSNHEGELIDAIQKAADQGYTGIILNGAGFTHTSVALRDAVAATPLPVVEVHISNIHAREEFRQHTLTGEVATGVITGLGTAGYHLAVQYFQERHATTA
ncbi:MAG: type II 3-dehydroquinate dehydratase [Rhodothermales bacterium]